MISKWNVARVNTLCTWNCVTAKIIQNIQWFFFKTQTTSGHIRGAAGGNWLQGISPWGSKALIGESQVGKALRTLAPECLLLLLCLCMFAAPFFSGIWHVVNGHGEIPNDFSVVWFFSWKYSVLLGIFVCELLWRWVPPKLYHLPKAMILYNNNVTSNGILMIKSL